MPRQRKVFNIETEIDPTDKCTLISVVPFLINEFKPGIYPGRFIVNPCTDPKQPQFLNIGMSVYFIKQFNGDAELPDLVIKTTSKEIAKSVVNDYMLAQMDVTEECRPGLVWLSGEVTKQEFLTEHVSLYGHMIRAQNNWYGKLVQRADNDWNRYRNSKVVSDNQRFAARALGLEREYLMPDNTEIPIKCPSCFSQILPQAVVCSTCRFILNKKAYNAEDFAA